LFDAEWTSIGVKVAYEESRGTVRAELEVGAVSDPVRRDRLSGQLGRRGRFGFLSSFFPLPGSLRFPFTDFSLSSLYDRTLSRSCPVASSSSINLIVPTHSVNPFVIEPAAGREMKSVGGLEAAVWDVNEALKEKEEGAGLDVRVRWPEENVFRYRELLSLPSFVSTS
jgi:phosphatidylinositol glycan class T